MASSLTSTGAVTEPDSVAKSPARHIGIDSLRGLVMLIMVLDHVRTYLSDAQFSPTNLARTSPELFFTRWITHFCAPVFMLLAGLSIYLARDRFPAKAQQSKFLIQRGFFFIALEIFVYRFGWNLSGGLQGTNLFVFWALGFSTLVMAALIWVPIRALLPLSFAAIALHNLLDHVSSKGSPIWHAFWSLFHSGGGFKLGSGYAVGVLYPVFPWFAVMALGYCLGPLYDLDRDRRRKLLLAIGWGCIVAFIALRATNFYGDPKPWSPQSSPLFSALSVLNTQKYPPSLAYLLMTLGPSLLALAALDRARGKWVHVLVVYGSVPLFFYTLHLFINQVVCYLHACFVASKWLDPSAFADGSAAYGTGLLGVYLMTIAICAALYLPCVAFRRYRREHKSAWLRFV